MDESPPWSVVGGGGAASVKDRPGVDAHLGGGGRVGTSPKVLGLICPRFM